MNKKRTTRVATAVMITLAIAGCSSPAAYADSKPNHDPKHAWVHVFDQNGRDGNWEGASVDKRCDGSTLVYTSWQNYADGSSAGSGGLAVIPNSPECT